MVGFSKVVLPDFGRSEDKPEIESGTYMKRIRSTVDKLRQGGMDVLVVYADREHSANMSFLSGFDPRFEEALLLLSKDGRKKLLVGNECMGYLPSEDLGIEIELFQDFSLMGQQRDSSRALKDILKEFGIAAGAKIGCAGWKKPSVKMIGFGSDAIEIPSYLADLLRNLAGSAENVVNANDIFMNSKDGLRAVCEPEQIAFFEYASTTASDSMLKFIRNLKPGIREHEAAAHLNSRGLDLSCHTMTSFGAKVSRGLSSPGDAKAKVGDLYTAALGVTGALSSRAGYLAASPEDVPAETREFYEKYIKNYFSVVVAWYQSVRIGITGGEVFSIVEKQRDPELFHFAVNTGHLLHLDEWVNSPFSAGDKTPLKSGMAIQADIIPISNGPSCFANMEDGIVLADAELRAELAKRYPGMYQRIEARRQFMKDALGIKLDESVLPLSNIPAWLPPFALNEALVLVNT